MTPRVASTQRRERRAGQRSHAEHAEDHERHIHAEHDEIAMGKIDDVHHAPDQRQARGEQCIDGTEEESADDHLHQKERH